MRVSLGRLNLPEPVRTYAYRAVFPPNELRFAGAGKTLVLLDYWPSDLDLTPSALTNEHRVTGYGHCERPPLPVIKWFLTAILGFLLFADNVFARQLTS